MKLFFIYLNLFSHALLEINGLIFLFFCRVHLFLSKKYFVLCYYFADELEILDHMEKMKTGQAKTEETRPPRKVNQTNNSIIVHMYKYHIHM